MSIVKPYTFTDATKANANEVNANFDTVYAGVNALQADIAQRAINVKSAPYNAKGDGVTDDTAAIQAAINAASSLGIGIVDFPKGYYLLNGTGTELLLLTKQVILRGQGINTQLLISASVGATTDVIRISPTVGSGDGYGVEGITIVAVSGTPARHAINLDITNAGQFLSRMSIRRNFFYRTGGWSIYLTNPTNTDGFYTSWIENNYIESGIYLNRGGDSLTITGNTMTSYNGLYVSLVTGSKELVFENNNFTARGGIIIKKGNSAKINYNNIEINYADMSLTNNAMVDIDGSDETTKMYAIEVKGNDITYGAGATVPVNAIRIAKARGTLIEQNFIGNNAGLMISITAAAQNTRLGYNLYSCSYSDGTGFITDLGLNTIRKEVPVDDPSDGIPRIWQNVSDYYNDDTTNRRIKADVTNYEGKSTSTNSVHRFLYPQAFAGSLKAGFTVARRTTGGGIDLEKELFYFDTEKLLFPTIGFAIAGNGGTTQRVKSMSAAPTTGTYAVGDIVFNSAPTSGGFIGWVCTVAGTPGTWKTWGVIS